MADDLVVREWAVTCWRDQMDMDEHNAVVRAYLAVVAERDEAKRRATLLEQDCEGYSQQETELRALIDKGWNREAEVTRQLTAMTAERDEGYAAKERYRQFCHDMREEYQELKAQLTASEAALRKYGRHADDCIDGMVWGHCSCGWNALAEPPGEPFQKVLDDNCWDLLCAIRAAKGGGVVSTGTHYTTTPAYLMHEIDNFRWSLITAEAELEDARRTLERVNGRAQVPDDVWPDYRLKDALREIREMCERGRNRG